MKHKIIHLSNDTVSSVLLFIDVDEMGDEYIKIMAWHDLVDETHLQEGIITAPSLGVCEQIISSFDKAAAMEFISDYEP